MKNIKLKKEKSEMLNDLNELIAINEKMYEESNIDYSRYMVTFTTKEISSFSNVVLYYPTHWSKNALRKNIFSLLSKVVERPIIVELKRIQHLNKEKNVSKTK